jgi:hypothetical protein
MSVMVIPSWLDAPGALCIGRVVVLDSLRDQLKAILGKGYFRSGTPRQQSNNHRCPSKDFV